MKKFRPASIVHRSKGATFTYKDLEFCSHVFVKVDSAKKSLTQLYTGPQRTIDHLSSSIHHTPSTWRARTRTSPLRGWSNVSCQWHWRFASSWLPYVNLLVVFTSQSSSSIQQPDTMQRRHRNQTLGHLGYCSCDWYYQQRHQFYNRQLLHNYGTRLIHFRRTSQKLTGHIHLKVKRLNGWTLLCIWDQLSKTTLFRRDFY